MFCRDFENGVICALSGKFGFEKSHSGKIYGILYVCPDSNFLYCPTTSGAVMVGNGHNTNKVNI